MGQRTDARIAAWQEAAGIEPATGDRFEMLRGLSRSAYEMIRLIELEASGIRDGAGSWYGSDPLDGAVAQISSGWERVKEAQLKEARREEALDAAGRALRKDDPLESATPAEWK